MRLLRRKQPQKWGLPMPAEFHELADYNDRVSKGIVHTPEYMAHMAEVDRRFSEWSDACYRAEGYRPLEGTAGTWVREPRSGGSDE